jgi:hypothetical protein
VLTGPLVYLEHCDACKLLEAERSIPIIKASLAIAASKRDFGLNACVFT